MGKFTVGNAISALLGNGVRVQRGYPGDLMPQLTGAVAAVNMHKWEPMKNTILATICAPMTMGVYACEDLAERVVKLWGAEGGVCSYGDLGFDRKSGIYTLEVYGVWEDPEEDTETTEEATT